nr:putative serine/threonine-protein kinase receptor [Ziziphus jujuba var. spinosa]
MDTMHLLSIFYVFFFWYLGLWYKTTPDVVVWVANSNNPRTDSYGQITITNHGNLLLLNRTRTFIWYSNTSTVAKDPVARLLESGNLVVQGKNREADSETYAWQSFDYPTDTSLAGMKIGRNLKIGLKHYLTSWKSADDPKTLLSIWTLNNESYYMFKPKVNKEDEITCLKLSDSVQQEWQVLNCSDGGVRKTPLDCNDGGDFEKLVGVKFPNLLEFWWNKSMNLEECKEMCTKNCSCAAYANSDTIKGGGGYC